MDLGQVIALCIKLGAFLRFFSVGTRFKLQLICSIFVEFDQYNASFTAAFRLQFGQFHSE